MWIAYTGLRSTQTVPMARRNAYTWPGKYLCHSVSLPPHCILCWRRLATPILLPLRCLTRTPTGHDVLHQHVWQAKAIVPCLDQ